MARNEAAERLVERVLDDALVKRIRAAGAAERRALNVYLAASDDEAEVAWEAYLAALLDDEAASRGVADPTVSQD